MRSVYLLGILLFSSLPVFSSEYLEQLRLVDSIRLSDHKRAEAELSSIPVSALEQSEALYYRYLQGLILTVDTELSTIIARFEMLLLEVRDPDLRIRILGSLINLLGVHRNWTNGLQRVEELLALLQEYPESPFKPDAYLNLAHFHLNLGQPETALHFAERALSIEVLLPRIRCGLHLTIISSKSKLKLNSLSLTEFSEAHEVCTEANQSYTIVNINIWKAKWLLQQSRFEEAQTVLTTTLMLAKTFPANGQLIELYSLFSIVKLINQDLEKAQLYADKALALEFKEDFPLPLIDIYDVLRQIAEQKEQYELAYEYLMARQELEKNIYERQLADEIAIQQARFDIDAKQSEIEFLDKQNELLKAESMLVNERLESSLLALGMVSILLSSLLFWSYRSRKVQAKLKQYAQTDALTKIANRGYFTDCLQEKLTRAQKKGSLVGLILLDLDHFKHINDTYGHQVGDFALVEAAKAIKNSVGSDAIVGRLGGEEFGALITGKPKNEILSSAERCRVAIEAIQSTMTEYQFKLTVSAGVSYTSQTGYTLESLYSAADLALYQSKHYGRNRVYEYSSTMANSH